MCLFGKPDRRIVTLANTSDAHHETSIASFRADLIGVNHHARIAESGSLNGVFTRKGGTEKEPAGWRQLAFGVESIREFIGMLKERVGQTTVSLAEPIQDVIETVLDFLVRKLQNALEDRIRSGLLLVEALVAWDEEASNHPRRISRDADRETPNELRLEHRHRRDVAVCRTCCIVERNASVDSVPWLRLAPHLCRPS